MIAGIFCEIQGTVFDRAGERHYEAHGGVCGPYQMFSGLEGMGSTSELRF